MASTSIIRTERLLEEMKTASIDNITIHPDYIDPDTFRPGSTATRLRYSSRASAGIPPELQYTFFDFLGQCTMCAGTKRHIHGIQGPHVLEVEGFPGLYIYRKHISNSFVAREILDTIMHDGIADSGTTLIIVPDARVVHLQGEENMFTASEQRQVSFSDASESGETTTSSARELTDRIEEVQFDQGLPAKLQKLFDAILPIQTRPVKTARFSSAKDSTAVQLHREDMTQRDFQHVSLGCDGIVVVGLENEEAQPAAIRLRSGDVVVWEQPGEGASYDIARVLEGTDSSWEKAWPCWRLPPGVGPDYLQGLGREGMDQSWKGCMKGRRVDLLAG